MHITPKIAVIDSNTLACIGMKGLLQSIIDGMEVDTFGSFAELETNHPDEYFHYFVAMNIVLPHLDFFLERRRKTIVMTMSADPESNLDKFHCLCVNVPETSLVKSLLSLEQCAHPHGSGFPIPSVFPSAQKVLSNREIEVLALIVKGFINKEIADRLNVSLSTIISHRKNIIEKLNRKSVGSLTIYAVMHGYVSINEL